ncbi:DUF1804 family protein [Wielerella bovis]|uniref:DUF1804 family protein n=1 Tax=Wielerella bovis TaxID=2917790 RepID=UPI002019686D|nr:DUF1804 family protein [Wielerella bovis]MCG7656870.1 DUF1804 family protein [Wielerella bovis]
MAHPKEVREKVRRDYINGRQTLEVAAMLNKVPLATARMWKKSAKEMGDDWDKVRAAYLLAGGGVEEVAQMMLAGLIIQYQDVMTRLQEEDDLDTVERVKLLGSLSDSYAKNISTNQKLMPKTSELAVAMKLLNMQMEWVKENCPQHLPAFWRLLSRLRNILKQRFHHE